MINESCFFCSSQNTKEQSLNRIYCLSCKKRYSLKKIQRLKKIIECFALEVPALKASSFLNISYKTVHQNYQIIRKKIAAFEKTNPLYELLDDFCTKDERFGKETLFLSVENGLLFAKLFEKSQFKKDNLLRFENERDCKLTVFQSSNPSYFSGFKREYGQNSDFYPFLKRMLKKYQGISKNSFKLYLSEAVFRYNNRKDNLTAILTSLWQKIPNSK